MSSLYPNQHSLFSGFQTPDKSGWLKQAASDLAGKNFDKLLLGKEVDGVKMYPFYGKEDLHQDFVCYRNFSDKAYTHQSWEFQEYIQLTDSLMEKEVNALVLKTLEQGTEALLFDGTVLSKKTNTHSLLQDIIPEGVTISWKLPSTWPKDQWDEFSPLYGIIHIHPLEKYLTTGENDQQGLDLLFNLLEYNLPHLKKLSVSGEQFVNSGASVLQEAALTCNLLVAYLDLLTDRGHQAQDLFHSIEISLATRSAYFVDIAKYRAMQILLHQLANTYGVKYEAHFPLRAVSSEYNKSAYEAHTNILRNTAEAMAAVIGGCKTINILPHTGQHSSETVFSRRIARNVSHILRHEVHLDLVEDTVAGSYALESLTRQIAEQAWTYFLEIEKEGGILKAFEKGKVQKDIAAQTTSLLAQAGSMKKVFIGANRYVDVSVQSPSAPQFLEANTTVEIAKNLKNISGPAVIESIRYKVDHAVALGKSRPVVGLIRMNDQTKSSVLNTRFSFLQDLFASVGINTKKLTSAFLSLDHPSDILSGLDALVLVSDDEQYASLKAEETKPAILSYPFPCMLAGYPEPIVNARENYGLYAFIHWGMNLPDFAKQFFKAINFGTDEA